MGMTQFFALREDMLPLLAKIESKGPLHYALAGRFLEPRFESYSSGAEIPDLCIATNESASSCARYLVCEPSIKLSLRTVTETDHEIGQYESPIASTSSLIQTPLFCSPAVSGKEISCSTARLQRPRGLTNRRRNYARGFNWLSGSTFGVLADITSARLLLKC
jgi:hypothetical protein